MLKRSFLSGLLGLPIFAWGTKSPAAAVPQERPALWCPSEPGTRCVIVVEAQQGLPAKFPDDAESAGWVEVLVDGFVVAVCGANYQFDRAVDGTPTLVGTLLPIFYTVTIAGPRAGRTFSVRTQGHLAKHCQPTLTVQELAQ